MAESSNVRIDEYGGSIENRSRFILDAMQEMEAGIGADKVGIKLSPSIPYNSILESNPIATYSYLIKELNNLPLAYIHLMNAMFLPEEGFEQYTKDVMETFGTLTNHTVIANAGYTRETGEQELEKGIAKLISFEVPFIANPDLPKRFEINAELSEPDRNTFYVEMKKGIPIIQLCNKILNSYSEINKIGDITYNFAKILEESITSNTENYLWSHKCWKHFYK